MIKVIEYGRRRVRCPHCSSLLEFEKEDVQCRQSGMNEYTYYITCPNCQGDIGMGEQGWER